MLERCFNRVTSSCLLSNLSTLRWLALSVGQVCCKIKVPHTNMIPCSTWPELELSLSSTSARFSTSPDPKT